MTQYDQKKESKTRELRLRKVPPDIYNILLKEQAEKKISCNCQYSLEQTVYLIIRKNAKNG